MRKYYIDTAIWRDLHENRKDRFRPLGEWAFELFKVIRANKEEVLYSDMVIDELSKDFDKEKIHNLFDIARQEKLLKKVEINGEQVKEAARLNKKSGIPFGDCLHAILARDNDAVMVTRDHHFEMLQDIADVKKPEDLI
jgi:predicted nucleic acid-binding protein